MIGTGMIYGYPLIIFRNILEYCGFSFKETGNKGKGLELRIDVPAGRVSFPE